MNSFGTRIIGLKQNNIGQCFNPASTPFYPFPSIVGDQALKSIVTYSVALDPIFLNFAVKIPLSKNYNEAFHSGDFQADLWKQDVVEIFLASDSGSQYQEFNLSPSGAYWTVRFSDYRARIPSSDSALSGIKVEILSSTEGKILSIQIPRIHILKDCSFSEISRIQCCAIIGQSPRTYFSTAKIDAAKPDFHQTANWGYIKLE